MNYYNYFAYILIIVAQNCIPKIHEVEKIKSKSSIVAITISGRKDKQCLYIKYEKNFRFFYFKESNKNYKVNKSYKFY
jgi:hypothetical protein